MTEGTAFIDLRRTPPDEAAIAAKRREIASSPEQGSLTALIARPLPFVDIGIGLAAAGIDHLIVAGDRDMLADDPTGTARDWSMTMITLIYAAKVAASGRRLIAAETAALELHATCEGVGRHAFLRKRASARERRRDRKPSRGPKTSAGTHDRAAGSPGDEGRETT